MRYRSQLRAWNIRNARVILRADLNVPLKNGNILNDLKLQAIQPTLTYLISQGCIITLLTHIGNPQHPGPELSTRVLLPWFSNNNYAIEFAEHINAIPKIILDAPEGTIILCENMRFFKGEKAEDLSFAQELRQCGDFYINDGFESMHRSETSITLLPTLFAPEKKTIGFYTEQELTILDSLILPIKKPFVCIIGGKKISSKLPFLHALLDIVDTLVLCPAIVFTFLKAQQKPVGKSLVDDSLINECKEIMALAKEKGVHIIIPIDMVISFNQFEPPYQVVATDAIPTNATGISIGPQTNTDLITVLNNAHTILYNGAMGFLEYPTSLQGMYGLLQIIAHSKATTLIAGGDSAATVYYFDMPKQFTHISLGGGATLFYITHQTLPALQALNK